jgi:hypothetical protein
MPPLGALTQASTAAEAALPLGWQVSGLYRFGGPWVGLAEGPAFDDYASGSGQYAQQALRRLSDRLRERRGPTTGGDRVVATPLLLVVLLLLAGCQSALPSPSVPRTPRPTPEAVPNELPAEFGGFGSLSTEDFALGDDRYAIDWSVTPVPGYPCRHWVLIRNNDTGHTEEVLDMVVGADDTVYDTTYAWDLAPGRYRFDANSRCDWTLSIDEDDSSP